MGESMAVRRLAAELAAAVIEGQALVNTATDDPVLDAKFAAEMRRATALARALCPEARDAIDAGARPRAHGDGCPQ